MRSNPWMGAAVGVALVACFGVRDIEKEAGWRGVPLGAAPGEVEGLVQEKADPLGEVVYTRPDEPDTWGRAKIAVRYHFWDEALWKVEVRTGDSRALLDAVKGDYGTPPFSQPWTWDGERVRMHFQGHEYDSAAVVTIVSKPLEARRAQERPARKAEAEAKAKAAAKARAEAKAKTEDTDAPDTDAPDTDGDG